MSKSATGKSVLVIACGALAKEILLLIEKLGLQDRMELTCLPADYHNRPAKIIPGLQEKLQANLQHYQRFFIGYGDCGTGGLLDKWIEEKRQEGINISRIEGVHCYEFYAGHNEFNALQEKALGSFYLTDYLVRFFERLIIQGLKLDKYPQLMQDIFGNYTDLVYLAQTDDDELNRMAEQAAKRLGLTYSRIYTGYGGLADSLATIKEMA